MVKKLSVDLISYEDVNSPQAVAKFQKYNADLFVSMSFDQPKKDIILYQKWFELSCWSFTFL